MELSAIIIRFILSGLAVFYSWQGNYPAAIFYILFAMYLKQQES
jgi:hypothetical protein